MFRGQRVLALIPARGGSKGCPGKNSRLRCGRPLVAWSVVAALGSSAIDSVVVSTDDMAVADAARAAGADVPFVRPAELAGDDAPMSEVIRHALRELEASGVFFDYLVLLQPTSPLRTSADIDAAFERLADTDGSAVVSVCQAEHSPRWIGRLPEDGNMDTFLDSAAARSNRQDLGTFFRLNGSIYLAEVPYLIEQGGFLGPATYALVMSQEDSVDVDTELDFEVAECLLAKRLDTAR